MGQKARVPSRFEQCVLPAYSEEKIMREGAKWGIRTAMEDADISLHFKENG